MKFLQNIKTLLINWNKLKREVNRLTIERLEKKRIENIRFEKEEQYGMFKIKK